MKRIQGISVAALLVCLLVVAARDGYAGVRGAIFPTENAAEGAMKNSAEGAMNNSAEGATENAAEDPARDSAPLARKKVAVVLSGGGAKGVAHIGALKVIERAGIPVDIIVGTSMGSIIGGLYSIGYSPEQIDSMVMSQDWGFLLSDRTRRRSQTISQKEDNDKYQVRYSFGRKLEGVGGLIEGTNLEMLFNDLMVGYHDSIDFDRLPIPFACVASNIVDGSPRIFRDGVLPVAMRASMAIPGVFSPVYLDDQVLVDGGVVNNFPTDIARQMGADVIIGVDVQSSLKTKEELVSATDVLGQLIDLAMQQQTYRRNVGMADVYVRVDVEGYSSASFNLPSLDSLVRRGEESAQKEWDGLVELRERVGVEGDPVEREPFLPLGQRGAFHVHDIVFENLTPRQTRWVMRKCRIAEHSDITVEKLNRCIAMLGAATSYSNIYYSLRDTLGGYNLTFHMDEVKDNTLSGGVSFDSEEIASVLMNGTFRLGKGASSVASVTGRLGKRLMVQVDYHLLTSPLSNFRFNYTYNHDNLTITSMGKRHFNPTFNRHSGGLSFVGTNFMRQNLRLEAGISYERFFYRSWLTSSGLQPTVDMTEVEGETFIDYFARVEFESRDDRFFTMRGTSWTASYELYSDNFFQYKGHAPISAFALSWMTAFPVSRRFSLIPSLYGRVLLGSDVPFPKLNMVGGKYFGRYMPQQMPFDGIWYMEAAPGSFVAARVVARQRIARRHYVSGSFNYAMASSDFLGLLVGRDYFGVSIDYGYDLQRFPLQASLSWSNITRSPAFYVQAGYTF
ncbi:MAG: patatin-like phospholipase family protein [Alistipes sp.]|jgi:NTE family protein|nr:patatin-like phospholipase family protein [Alistipes sp.]